MKSNQIIKQKDIPCIASLRKKLVRLNEEFAACDFAIATNWKHYTNSERKHKVERLNTIENNIDGVQRLIKFIERGLQ